MPESNRMFALVVKSTAEVILLIDSHVLPSDTPDTTFSPCHHAEMSTSNNSDPVTRIGWAIAKHQQEPHLYGAARAVIDQLHKEIEAYRAVLEQSDMTASSIHTYWDRAARFVRWLEGEYTPPKRPATTSKP